jgi:SAM-dependent methyltransferase
MSTSEFQPEKAEQFANRMVEIFNDGMLALMASIGHRTGLFDAMSGMSPATSQEIASRAGLQERYVREWLGSMVTGKIVVFDSARGTYHLPAEHAACLTRSAGIDNMAFYSQYVPVFGEVEEKVATCFKEGGGVGYEAQRRFQRLMAEESAMVHDAKLFSVILPLVDGIEGKLQAGIDVLDIGCGCGHAMNLMGKQFPNSRFVGVDFSEEGIRTAQAENARMGLSNVRFERKDVASLEFDGAFDLVTAFDSIHDQADPAKVLSNARRALKPGAPFLCVDITGSSHLEKNMDHPIAPALYATSTLHCMTVSLAVGGAGLGTMWGEEKAKEMMTAAGFTDIKVKKVEGDIMNNYYIARRPA